MSVKKALINIALTPLAAAVLLVVVALCVVSTALRYVFVVPYSLSKAVSEGCQALLRSFVEGYERGKVIVLGEVSRRESK